MLEMNYLTDMDSAFPSQIRLITWCGKTLLLSSVFCCEFPPEFMAAALSTLLWSRPCRVRWLFWMPTCVSLKEAGLSQALCTIPPHPAVTLVGQMHGRLMHLIQNPLESSLIADKKYSKPGTWGRKPGWRQALFWLKSPIVQRKGIEGGRREERLDRSEGPSVPFPGRGTTQPQWTIWPPEGLPLCKQLPWLADALYSRSVWLKYQRVTRELYGPLQEIYGTSVATGMII